VNKNNSGSIGTTASSNVDLKILVSIIIPTYNRAYLLQETLKSILNQTYTHLQVIVIDDGSTDSTITILKKFKDSRLSVLKNHTNLGESASINLGWNYCLNNLVAIVSDDDPQENSWLEKMINFRNENPGFIIYYPDLKIIDQNGLVKTQLILRDWSRRRLYVEAAAIASAGSLIDKSKLPDEFIPRDSKVKYIPDVIQMMNLSLFGDGIRAKNIFGVWREHDFNTSNTDKSFAHASEYQKYFIEWLQKNNGNSEVAKWSSYAKKNLIARSWKIIRKNNGFLHTLMKVICLPNYIRIMTNPKIIYLFIFQALIILMKFSKGILHKFFSMIKNN